jgi:hypothetical protein
MTMPGRINKFSGSLAGAAGQDALSGGAFGSFARRGKDPAAGVVANWGVAGQNYRATGVFGGVRR